MINRAHFDRSFQRAIENGWLKLHESGTFVTLTVGADLSV